jgi:hypothetical protein
VGFYQLNVIGDLAGEQTNNVFHYYSSGVPAGGELPSQSLWSLFGFDTSPTTSVAQSWLFCVSSAWKCTGIFVRDLYSDTDFFDFVYGTPPTGGQPAEFTSPFASYAFRTNRVRLNVRRGSKRIAGVSEVQVTNGIVISGFRAALADFAQTMSDTLTSTVLGSSLIFQPAVISLKRQISEETGKVEYVLYPPEEQLDHTAVGVNWQSLVNVTSQSTRKYGRGV